LSINVTDGLSMLLDQGLIHRVPARHGTRLAMLEPIRDYARERLREDPHRHDVLLAFAEHFATFADDAAAGLAGHSQVSWIERLDDEHARALVDLGASHRRAGERVAAREPLREGLDLAVTCGAVRLADRARTELAATGARPRRERTTGRDSLTPSELRIALLAADGRTSQEIAQSLFVTTKTIDMHLGHTYSKLGINSRKQLAAALAEPTLTDPTVTDPQRETA
jgi:DNA-binding CsgD family transcriptional regulator